MSDLARMHDGIKVGFIGLGSQGAPIARRMIDAGHDVTLWARRPASLEPFADTVRDKPPHSRAGARSDHVGICVLDDAGLAQVCDQLIPAMRRGQPDRDPFHRPPRYLRRSGRRGRRRAASR